jgi:hypothetical protein
MAIGQLLGADIQYLVMDYLAEVSMSLLARARMKAPDAGYPADFIAYLKPHLPELQRRSVRVITNAGGVNPRACKAALERCCAELGVTLRIAVVEGDDLMPIIEELRGEHVREWVSGEELPTTLLTANAYLGAVPIAAALRAGADVVITGRCADSALALGALMHEFDWPPDDYERLAAGSLVGHMLECGPQATGGLFTDWESVPDWHNIGYPIAACTSDGRFVLTKPPGTGGLVSPAAAAEQVLYEVGDPGAYILPDVIADFSQVQLETIAAEQVLVSGARGRAPTTDYKVSATYQDGFRAVAMVSIIGFDARRKAERTGQALLERARMLFERQGRADFSATHMEVLGSEAAYGTEARARDTREVILRLVVDHRDSRALEVFARELGSVGLSFAPGTTGLIGGRPKATPVVKLFTFFVKKSRPHPITISVGDAPPARVAIPAGVNARAATADAAPSVVPDRADPADPADSVLVPLIAVAHARSGDKGNTSNVAIFCRKPEFYAHLAAILSAGRIADHFRQVADGPVVRYEAAGLCAFNFVIENALGGGGMASARIDPQGKAYGQRALEMLVPIPRSWGIGMP